MSTVTDLIERHGKNNDNDRPQRDRPKREYRSVARFPEAPQINTVVLEVNKSSDYIPRYSFKLGTLRENEERGPNVSPFVNIHIQGQKMGDVHMDDLEERVVGYVRDMFKWVREDAAYEAAKFIDNKVDSEQARASRGAKPQQRVMREGKTAKKKAKLGKQ